MVGGILMSTLLNYLEASPTIMAIPAVFAAGFVLLRTSFLAIYKHRRSFSSSGVCLAVAGVVFAFLPDFLKNAPENLPSNPVFQTSIDGHFLTWPYIPSAILKS